MVNFHLSRIIPHSLSPKKKKEKKEKILSLFRRGPYLEVCLIASESLDDASLKNIRFVRFTPRALSIDEKLFFPVLVMKSSKEKSEAKNL